MSYANRPTRERGGGRSCLHLDRYLRFLESVKVVKGTSEEARAARAGGSANVRDEVGIPAGKKALAGCPVSLRPVPVPARPTMTTDTGKCPVARTEDSASLLGAELMAASALHIASASE